MNATKPQPQPKIIERTYRVTLTLTVDVGMEMDEGEDASLNAMLHAEREVEKRLNGARSLTFFDIEALECVLAPEKEKK